MSSCPVSGRSDPRLWKCDQFTDWSTCSGCPVRSPIVRVYAFLFPYFKLILIMLTLLVSLVRVAPVQAAHNEQHSCATLDYMIRQGTAGGFTWVAGNRLTWVDGAYDTYAVFVDGLCRTVFDLDDNTQHAMRYVSKDVASHGASRVGVSAIKSYFKRFNGGELAGPSGSAVIGAIPTATWCRFYPYARCGVREVW